MTEKKETRGRKKNQDPATKVSWAIPGPIYRSLQEEQKEIEENTGVKLLISQVAYKRLAKK